MSTTRPLAAVTSTIPLIFKRHLSPFVTNFRRARRTLCKLKTSKRRTPDFITVRFSSRRVIEFRLKWNCKCEGPRSFRTIPLGRLSCPRVKVKELSQLGQFKTICLVQPSRWNVTLGATRPHGSPGGARTTRFCPLVDQYTEGIFSRSSRSRRRTGALTIAWPKTESDAGPKVNFFLMKIPGLFYENLVFTGNIAVEVEFAPVVSVPRPRLGQALQYDMDLECHVEAYPPPALTWVKDEVALSNNQHYSISHFATADEFTDTTLRVITIEKRQYGQYVCKAANKLGTAEGRVELFGKNFDD
jgi:hypothetical protein